VILVPLLNPKFATRTRREVCANFGFAALVPIPKFASIRGDLWANFGIERTHAGNVRRIRQLTERYCAEILPEALRPAPATAPSSPS